MRQAATGGKGPGPTITFLLIERTYLESIRQATSEINRRHGVNLRTALHLLPDLRSEADWASLAADVASSLAVFAIHVTEESLAARIGSLVQAAPESLRAFVPINCVGSLMGRARLGRLSLSARRGFMSRFGGLIRRPSGDRSADSFVAFVGRLSRWLRFAPGRAQDLRTYLLLYTYYLQSSPDNFRNLLLLTLARYGHFQVEVEPPVEYPPALLYHPEAPRLFVDRQAYLEWFHARPGAPPRSAPKVGVILFRSFVLNRNTAHYDAVIKAIEARGLVPLPALAFALDNRVVQAAYFQDVGAILSLTGFGYVGGMGANDPQAAIESLTAQGVPYLNAIALNFQRIDQWLASEVGLNPLQSMMQVAIPELDGATEPFIVGGVSSTDGAFEPLPDRVDRLADRLSRLVSLRVKPNAEKRVAVNLF
ncbi:MAG: cobaltochelatase subunit CobN, partial [Chloroflexota bacterium]